MGQIRCKALDELGLARVSAVYDYYPISDSTYSISNSIDEILSDKSIDAVFICTPNHLNQKLTIKSMRAGKACFL